MQKVLVGENETPFNKRFLKKVKRKLGREWNKDIRNEKKEREGNCKKKKKILEFTFFR